MFESILVPLDGSDTSKLAVPTALQLAQRWRASVHFVQVHVPVTVADFVEASAPELLEEQSIRQQELADLRAEVRAAEVLGLPAHAALLDGPIARALEQYAEHERIELVVMTTHARTGFARAVLGSIADAIVRRTFLPVLLIRPESMPTPHSAEFERVLVPLDGSAIAEHVLPPALQVASDTGELVLVRVVGEIENQPEPGATAQVELVREERATADEYLSAVTDRVSSQPRRVRSIALQGGPAARGILLAATQVNADLIAMSTHGRSGVSRALLGSVADQVLQEATVPVLLIRAAREPRRAARTHLALSSIFF